MPLYKHKQPNELTSIERARVRYYNKLTPEQKFAKHLRWRFKITPDDYYKLVDKQDNKCAICGKEPDEGKRLVIDHCHASKLIRGLLCQQCNTGIGMFSDRYRLINKAAEYVRAFNDETFPPLNKL